MFVVEGEVVGGGGCTGVVAVGGEECEGFWADAGALGMGMSRDVMK